MIAGAAGSKQRLLWCSAAALIKSAFLLIVWSGFALAQTASITAGKASGSTGTAVSFSVTFASGSKPVSSLQFDLGFSSPSLSYISAATGSAASAAQKSVSANAVTGGARILIFGFNQTIIGAGTVATVELNIAAGAAPGVVTVALKRISAADPSGAVVPIAGFSGSITVNDTTPPIITDVAASAVTNSFATIKWTTNEAADSQVEYGTSTGYGSVTSLNQSRVFVHSQSLSGLSPSTQYHYRVKSKDAAGNLAASGDYTFTTSAVLDTTPPTIRIVSPTSSPTYTAMSSPLTISGTSTDNLGVTQIAWANNRGGSGIASGTASWSASGITLQRGSNVVTMTARDAAGNSSRATLTVTYNPIDTTAPTITITTPTSGTAFTAISGPLTIGGTASDNVGVTQVTWSSNRGGSGTAAGTTSWSVPGIALQSGSNVITVSARDAAGNSGTDTLTVTYKPSDAVPPTVTITVPTSSSSCTASSSPLTIGGTASDNVGVKEVTWSSNRGGSGSASGTTSWSASGIILQSGSNVITVTASDAAGNSGTGTITVTYQADTTPPVISAVSARAIATGAVILWTTDKPSDSQVEYGISTGYGNSTVLDAKPTTSHTQCLSGLAADTDYHFRVKSRDATGALAVSPDSTFRTAAPGSEIKLTLYYPVISSLNQAVQGQNADDYTAIALSNQGSDDAILSFTLYGASGVPLEGEGITNPVTAYLRPGEQMPIIDVQLFGDGIGSAGPQGWIQVDSTTSKLAGFFMTFDGRLSFLDGAEIPSSLPGSFVLPEIADQGFTRLLLANPNDDAASAKLHLMRADGSIRGSVEKIIDANATLAVDLYDDIFKGINAEPSNYVKVVSTKGLLPYQILGKTSKDIAILAGQDSYAGASQLYSPQYAVGGPWHTSLSILNLDATPGTLALKLITDGGSQIGDTQFVDISAGGKVYISDQTFFTDQNLNDPEQVVQGYVEITGIGLHLTGSVVFADADQGSFSAALPLASTLQKSVIFSHVASNDTYFTGLAILNPNESPASATIDLYSSDGKREATVTQVIPARQRRSKLLTEYFPALAGQSRTSGYFKVTVDQEVACFALFGTGDLSVLSAIPAQPTP